MSTSQGSLGTASSQRIPPSERGNTQKKIEPPPPLDNARLMEYATYMLTNCSTPTLLLPKDCYMPTYHLGNSCVSPIVAARGWGLLSLMADGKTKTEMTSRVAKLIGCRPEEVHSWLGRVDKRLRGVVFFFTEYQKHAMLDNQIITSAKETYGNKVKDPLQRMCFLCDHDSLRTSYVVNRTISDATGGRVQYVVREDNAPNRCTQTLLTSAVDCTFFWKHDNNQLKEVHTYFRGKKPIKGWVTEGRFPMRKDPGGVVLRLDSYQNDLKLILFLPASETSPTADEVLELGKNISASERPVKIFVPQFSVATPLCLRDCSREGPFNMKRVFDREKSDLSGYIKKFHDFSPTLEVLWDHYHKVTFTIVNGEKRNERAETNGGEREQKKDLHLQIGFRERCKLITSAWNCNKENIILDLNAQSARYCEDRLQVQSTNPVPDVAPVVGDAVFNEPFYFLVVQDIHNEPLIHCFGRFTNVNAVSTVSEPHPPSV